MKSLLTLLLILSYFASTLSAQTNSIRVLDPQKQWKNGPATIEEAVLSIHPRGAYMEYGLYLTYSAKGLTNFVPGDTLEVEHFFTLPDKAVVFDSWLWINDDICKARILDRWTAGAIYEGIVKRRKDPSILYKNGAITYEFRIFPMRADQTRRVKLTWLMPADWKNKSVLADLPINMIKNSLKAVDKFTVLFWPGSQWSAPQIQNNPAIAFTQEITAGGEKFYRAKMPVITYSTPDMRIEIRSPMSQGYYAETFSDGKNSFFQVVAQPAALLDEEIAKKTLILIDHEPGGATVPKDVLMKGIKSQLIENSTAYDSFNIIFSGLTPLMLNNGWISATEENIDAYLNPVLAAPNNYIQNFSNLISLISSGLQFIKNHGNDGKILLISNNRQYKNPATANDLLAGFYNLLEDHYQISILDLNTVINYDVYLNGKYYFGSEYFFRILASKTKGLYERYYETGQNITKSLENGFTSIAPHFSVFDFQTKLKNGLCFGRFYMQSGEEVVPAGKPVVQIGQYVGDLPLEIEMGGVYKGNFISQNFTIPASNIYPGDSTMREMWFGNFIQSIEKEPQTNSSLAIALANSLSERVLSRYTSFLCVEDTTLYCEECVDETELTATNDLDSLQIRLSASPNPFTDAVTIFFEDPAHGKPSQVEIYDIRGNLTEVLIPVFDGKRWSARLEGAGGLPAGVYLATVVVENKRHTMKLMKKE